MENKKVFDETFVKSAVRYEIESLLGNLKYDYDGNIDKAYTIVEFVEKQFDIDLENVCEWIDEMIEKENQ